jgi:hypothetical protein
MSLENISVVDAVGTEPATDCVVLSILDSWDWSDERSHLLALQNKLNSYFNFIESGQIYEIYPAAEGRPLRIDLICRYPLPSIATGFLNIATTIAEQLAVSVRWKVFADGKVN